MGTPYQPQQPQQQPQQPYAPQGGPVPYGPGGAPLSPVGVIGFLLGMLSIPGCFCCSCIGLVPYLIAVVCAGVTWMQHSNGQANGLSRNLAIVGVVIPTLFYIAITIFYVATLGVEGMMQMMNPENMSQFQDSFQSY